MALSTSVVTDAVVASTPVPYTIAPPYTLVFSSPVVVGPTTAPAILGPITLAVRDAVGNARTVTCQSPAPGKSVLNCKHGDSARIFSGAARTATVVGKTETASPL